MKQLQRISLLQKLGELLLSDDPEWTAVKERAAYENAWFIPEFIDYQLAHIAHAYLDAGSLNAWTSRYQIPGEQSNPRNVGIVMAGNIPLAGFHDFLTVFISGHQQTIKASSKDFHLINGIVSQLHQWDPETKNLIRFSERLKGCDAYIATGSNNSSRYFDYYFSRYPHIIRRNRTSAAILTGHESPEELRLLADDVHLYFGLGCRNVTKIYVPEAYDFVPLLESFKKYEWVFDHHKYKNNYDYQLAIMIINGMFYMTNGALLLQENKNLFSPISQLNYEYYLREDDVHQQLNGHPDIQCIVGNSQLPFGTAQQPGLDDYADKADTLQFLLSLS